MVKGTRKIHVGGGAREGGASGRRGDEVSGGIKILTRAMTCCMLDGHSLRNLRSGRHCISAAWSHVGYAL